MRKGRREKGEEGGERSRRAGAHEGGGGNENNWRPNGGKKFASADIEKARGKDEKGYQKDVKNRGVR